jgi:hypothetical protein
MRLCLAVGILNVSKDFITEIYLGMKGEQGKGKGEE